MGISWERWVWSRQRQTSSVKNRMVYISALQTRQSLWHKSSHRQYRNKWVWLLYNKTLFTKTGSGPDLPPTPTPGHKFTDFHLDPDGIAAESQLHCAVGPYISHLISLSLCSFMWKFRKITVTASQCCWDSSHFKYRVFHVILGTQYTRIKVSYYYSLV